MGNDNSYHPRRSAKEKEVKGCASHHPLEPREDCVLDGNTGVHNSITGLNKDCQTWDGLNEPMEETGSSPEGEGGNRE